MLDTAKYDLCWDVGWPSHAASVMILTMTRFPLEQQPGKRTILAFVITHLKRPASPGLLLDDLASTNMGVSKITAQLRFDHALGD